MSLCSQDAGRPYLDQLHFRFHEMASHPLAMQFQLNVDNFDFRSMMRADILRN